MNISDKLLAVPQAETAGEESDDAFAFQKSWALYSILSSHLLGEDYLYIFEYHDDILHLNSEQPTSIEFIQIKKSDKNSWTIARLTKRPESGGRSILGKLFAHAIDFSGDSIRLRFVSDAHYNFSSEKIVHAVSIKQEDQEEICRKITLEHPALAAPDLTPLWFEQCVLSFDAHSEQLLGAVEKFIISVFGNTAKIRASALNDTLLRRAERSRYPSERINSFNELKSKKGLCRSEIEKLIKELKEIQESDVSWEDITHFVHQLESSQKSRLIYKGEFLRISNRLKINPDSAVISAFGVGLNAFNNYEAGDDSAAIVAHFNEFLRLNAPELISCFTDKQIAIIAIMTFCEAMMSTSVEST